MQHAERPRHSAGGAYPRQGNTHHAVIRDDVDVTRRDGQILNVLGKADADGQRQDALALLLDRMRHPVRQLNVPIDMGSVLWAADSARGIGSSEWSIVDFGAASSRAEQEAGGFGVHRRGIALPLHAWQRGAHSGKRPPCVARCTKERPSCSDDSSRGIPLYSVPRCPLKGPFLSVCSAAAKAKRLSFFTRP